MQITIQITVGVSDTPIDKTEPLHQNLLANTRLWWQKVDFVNELWLLNFLNLHLHLY